MTLWKIVSALSAPMVFLSMTPLSSFPSLMMT